MEGTSGPELAQNRFSAVNDRNLRNLRAGYANTQIANCMKAATGHGPNANVRANVFMSLQFERWLEVLGRCGGCSIMYTHEKVNTACIQLYMRVNTCPIACITSVLT